MSNYCPNCEEEVELSEKNLTPDYKYKCNNCKQSFYEEEFLIDELFAKAIANGEVKLNKKEKV